MENGKVINFESAKGKKEALPFMDVMHELSEVMTSYMESKIDLLLTTAPYPNAIPIINEKGFELLVQIAYHCIYKFCEEGIFGANMTQPANFLKEFDEFVNPELDRIFSDLNKFLKEIEESLK